MNAHQVTIVAEKLTQAFDPEVLTRLAREHGFSHRLRQITPHRLGLALLAAFASQPVETLADLQRCFNALHACAVSYKPFYKQLAKPAFPLWMRAVVHQLLEHLVLQVLAPLPQGSLARFSDLLIQDSTGLKVHDALREQFPGRYTSKAPAVAELHATMSVRLDQVVQLALTGQRADAREHLPAAATLTDKLLLGDRGYQAAEYCRQVDAQGGSYLIRCTRKVNPRLRRCFVAGQRRPEWEGKRLSEVLPHLAGQSADLDVEFPPARKRPHRVRLRLVLGWNPQQRTHLYLATNLPREEFPAAAVGQLYRLRWQVELLFKEWKSYCNLHRFGTANAEITEGLIWAALAAAILKRFLAHATQVVFAGGAISTRRTTMALAQHLPLLWRALRQATSTRLRPVRRCLRELLRFLQQNAQRSSPKREALRGRTSLGLQPAYDCLLGA